MKQDNVKTSSYGMLNMAPRHPGVKKSKVAVEEELKTMVKRMEALEALIKHVLGGHVLIRGKWVDTSPMSLKHDSA